MMKVWIICQRSLKSRLKSKKQSQRANTAVKQQEAREAEDQRVRASAYSPYEKQVSKLFQDIVKAIDGNLDDPVKDTLVNILTLPLIPFLILVMLLLSMLPFGIGDIILNKLEPKQRNRYKIIREGASSSLVRIYPKSTRKQLTIAYQNGIFSLKGYATYHDYHTYWKPYLIATCDNIDDLETALAEWWTNSSDW